MTYSGYGIFLDEDEDVMDLDAEGNFSEEDSELDADNSDEEE